MFRFDSAVTKDCHGHDGVRIAIGVPATYPGQSGLVVAASLDAKKAAEGAGMAAGANGDVAEPAEELDGLKSGDKTPLHCDAGSCSCRERLLKLAPRLRAHALNNGCAWLLDHLKPRCGGNSVAAITPTDAQSDSHYGECPR